jgi:hypothetical protein
MQQRSQGGRDAAAKPCPASRNALATGTAQEDLFAPSALMGWTTDMHQSDHGRSGLPEMGPHGQAVIDRVLGRVTELDLCEHAPEGFAFWIATRPDMLLCDFCYEAAQVLAENIRCASCGRAAGDRGKDAIVMARVAAWLGVHFHLCMSCAEQDLRHTEQPG